MGGPDGTKPDLPPSPGKDASKRAGARSPGAGALAGGELTKPPAAGGFAGRTQGRLDDAWVYPGPTALLRALRRSTLDAWTLAHRARAGTQVAPSQARAPHSPSAPGRTTPTLRGGIGALGPRRLPPLSRATRKIDFGSAATPMITAARQSRTSRWLVETHPSGLTPPGRRFRVAQWWVKWASWGLP
jgi:hypothetical protein